MTDPDMYPDIGPCQRCGATKAVEQVRDLQPARYPSLAAYLTRTHYDRLCQACLTAIGNLVEHAAEFPIGPAGTGVREGIHYYWEGDLVVFTELYHIAKGHCCQNRCRHCAYGYK